MNVRDLLIVLNIVGFLAIGGYLIWAVLSPKRIRAEGENLPANRVEFLPDEDLEGRRLERVLGWALLFGGILAVALPLYWLREPTRQDHATAYFEEGSIERGRTFYANSEMEGYDAVLSLQCANCHGLEGEGGTRETIIDRDTRDGPIAPERYTWKEPALNTVLLRFSPEEVAQIITYGRPGTPMPAFGVAGGGAENEQTITDLVAYLNTIQLSPEEAMAQADEELEAARGQAEAQLAAAEEAHTAAETAVDEAVTGVGEAFEEAGVDQEGAEELCAPFTDDEGLPATDLDPEQFTVAERGACSDLADALTSLTQADRELAYSEIWAERRADVSDGQLLFELNCARCHTRGWSTFDPTDPRTLAILGPAGGGGGQGGGIGFNLRDGASIRRFGPGETGFADQVQFVFDGSANNESYGNLGIGSGRMPGFGQQLTREQIEAIVKYERDDIDGTFFPSEDGGNDE